MKPIYNRFGRTIAWIKDNHIYDLHGKKVLGFVKSGLIFNYKGKFIGRCSNNFFRDLRGHAVVFMKGASGGPIIPIPQKSPNPPISTIPLSSPIPFTMPDSYSHPIDSLFWSRLTWDNFINQQSSTLAKSM